MSPRSLIRLDQIRRAGIDLAPETESDFSLGRYFDAGCTVNELVGHFVSVSGPSVGELPQVQKVDPTVNSKMPALGLIISKYSDTTCLIHVGPGVVPSSILGIGSLTPQKRYFIGSNSYATATLPSPPSGEHVLIQVIGHALSADQLLLVPNFVLISRTG